MRGDPIIRIPRDTSVYFDTRVSHTPIQINGDTYFTMSPITQVSFMDINYVRKIGMSTIVNSLFACGHSIRAGLLTMNFNGHRNSRNYDHKLAIWGIPEKAGQRISMDIEIPKQIKNGHAWRPLKVLCFFYKLILMDILYVHRNSSSIQTQRNKGKTMNEEKSMRPKKIENEVEGFIRIPIKLTAKPVFGGCVNE